MQGCGWPPAGLAAAAVGAIVRRRSQGQAAQAEDAGAEDVEQAEV